VIAELVAKLKPLVDKSRELADTVLVTDSLETLGAFAERLRAALLERDGPIAAAQVEVVVTPREGRPDRVRLGPFDVLVDAHAPPGQLFQMRPPISRAASAPNRL
jgi:hypothetical protein